MPPKRKRLRIRFSLKALLFILVLCALPLGWVGYKRQQAMRMREAVADIERINGSVRYDYKFDADGNVILGTVEPPGFEWIKRLLGEDIFTAEYELLFPESIVTTDRVVHLTMTSQSFSDRATQPAIVADDDLVDLPHLSRLRILNFGENPISNASMKYVAQLKSLHTLNLGGTRITDEGLEQIHPLSKLKILVLYGTGITDAGLEHLKQLPELDTLNLASTKVTDSGMGILADFPKLNGVNVQGTAVTDAGVAFLAQLPNLERLVLRDTAITDAAVSSLTASKRLDMLNLRNTKVSDASVPDLSRMTGLTRLDLRGTQVTDEGKSRIRQARPKCKVF